MSTAAERQSKRVIAAVAVSMITWALFGSVAGLIVGGVGLLVAAFGTFERDPREKCAKYGHDFRHLDGTTCVRCGHKAVIA